MNSEAKHRLNRLFDQVNDTTKREIIASGVNQRAKRLLLLKELIKEQMPNENFNRPTR
ncbi:MAG: hypothetical protein AB8E15_07975 [Bdellovibrionales bacterium]